MRSDGGEGGRGEGVEGGRESFGVDSVEMEKRTESGL